MQSAHVLGLLLGQSPTGLTSFLERSVRIVFLSLPRSCQTCLFVTDPTNPTAPKPTDLSNPSSSMVALNLDTPLDRASFQRATYRPDRTTPARIDTSVRRSLAHCTGEQTLEHLRPVYRGRKTSVWVRDILDVAFVDSLVSLLGPLAPNSKPATVSYWAACLCERTYIGM